MLRRMWKLLITFTACLGMIVTGCGATQTAAKKPDEPVATKVLPRTPTATNSRTRKPPETTFKRKAETGRKVRILKKNAKVAARCEKVLPEAREIAAEHDVDLGLVMAIARLESRYDYRARNKRSGAAGLMQVMPSTGRYFKCGDLYDLESNLACGARILKRYIKYFKGDTIYGIAAYHAGIVAPKRAWKAKKLPKNFHYVERVMQVRTRFKRDGCH
ncbi:MAG: soluble lytic murein transglycosylase-like protein [Myxococcota bacterium]|jgi:soluble lytic murein transglycosylase-like protein